MQDQWTICKHDPEWKNLFHEIALQLRNALGDLAFRIDHVGSTAVEDLDAKPIIDIQISVVDFETIVNNRGKIEGLGFVFREDNSDQTKIYFREMPGKRRTHIHVRQVGSFSEQITLLFRDYLRAHPADCMRYAQEKHRLFELFNNERSKYVEGKGPIVWDIVQKAHAWSQDVGWRPSSSDM